jgi:hypothetical protein
VFEFDHHRKTFLRENDKSHCEKMWPEKTWMCDMHPETRNSFARSTATSLWAQGGHKMHMSLWFTPDYQIMWQDIVLVWLRHPSVPGREVLAYALLDDQSNAVLVKQSVFERLRIEASPTNIKFSTVLSKDQLIASYHVRDLEVSDNHHQNSIRLSTVYTQDNLPADDNYSPPK